MQLHYSKFMSKILFFGYGANRSRQKLKEFLDKDLGEGIGAILRGYTLHVQELNQVPKTQRDLFLQVYGQDWKAYTIKKGEGVVAGVIWELEEEDLKKIKAWEFVGEYREIISVKILTSSDEEVEVLTEKSKDEFSTTFIVDGINYNTFAFSRREIIDPNDQAYYTQQQIQSIRKLLNEESIKE